MAAVQMNTRIDKALKEQGDASFAELGYSPSEAVRLVWGFAARNRHNRRAMAEFVDSLEAPKPTREEEERQARIEGILRGPALVQQYLREFGIDPKSVGHCTCEEMDEELGLALEEDEARIRAEANTK